MVDISSLKPGDVVKIIDAWPGYIGQSHEMDDWLGQRMTIRKLDVGNFGNGEEPCLRMLEDDGWYWSAEMIDCICRDDHIITDDEIMTLFS